MKIYCAGPLFTPYERKEMSQIAKSLELAGHETFLPHEDGLELSECIDRLAEKGIANAASLMSKAIFALDTYQILHECDALVANLNGRVPDEGTVSEASMAWAIGKLVIGYKTDVRTLCEGQDNPLVAGLFKFSLCGSIEEVVNTVQWSIYKMSVYDNAGERITEILKNNGDFNEIIEVILQKFNRST